MKKLICVLLAGVFAVAMFAGCSFSPASNVKIEGNGESVVSDGKFVYCIYRIGKANEPYSSQIRRLAVDNLGGESELIYDGIAYNLNLSEDGRIFFSTEDGISWIKPGDEYKIDLIKLEQFDRSVVLNGDWIYFRVNAEDGDYSMGIYRINVDSYSVETVLNAEVAGDFSNFRVVGDAIYYEVYSSKRFGLMKFDVLGGTKLLVTENEEYEHGTSGSYVTDKHIYISWSRPAVIKRFDLYGQNAEVIFAENEAQDSKCWVEFADAEFVYYSTEDGYYRIKADGTGQSEKIPPGHDGYWNSRVFVAGKLFVHSYKENDDRGEEEIYCVDRDGKNSFRLK